MKIGMFLLCVIFLSSCATQYDYMMLKARVDRLETNIDLLGEGVERNSHTNEAQWCFINKCK